MKCSAKECNEEAVEDCGFFTNPMQYQQNKDIGIMFSFCRAHSAYYKVFRDMGDYAIGVAQQVDRWHFLIGRFSDYQKLVAQQAPKRQQQLETENPPK